jgi:hypothetical protein
MVNRFSSQRFLVAVRASHVYYERAQKRDLFTPVQEPVLFVCARSAEASTVTACRADLN